MRQVTTADKLRYWFDNVMSKGAIALIGWLALLSTVLILVISGFVWIASLANPADDGSMPTFGKVVWDSLMRTLDAGTMGGDTGGYLYLGSMLAVTLGGIFVVSMLIGVLTSGIEAKLEELRKGRSFVVEENHTVILGWSPHVFTIISELVQANESRSRPCIAILADKDKVEMEDEIKSRIADPKNTRIVCRSGNPLDLADLDIVNPQTSRAIIVLSPEEHKDPDTYVIKALLALINSPTRRKEPYHIVAEIQNRDNYDVARMVGGNEAELIITKDVISRIAVQTCRQSGLSVVYTELMDFGGDEIYFADEYSLTGKTFGESLSAYETCSVLGLRKASGAIMLNPPMDTPIEGGDKLIVVAEDDSKIKIGPGNPRIDEDAISISSPHAPKTERTLILGWNNTVPLMIQELDAYVAPGSDILVVADDGEAEAAITELAGTLQNQKLRFQKGDTASRKLLDELKPLDYDHIITVSYTHLDPQDADARTLITLLHLRDMAQKAQKDVAIVSEMLDPRNRDLAEVTEADDFIVSDRLISLLMSQISENKELFHVFADLFQSDGSEIHLKPASDYVKTGRPVNFYTVVEAARRRGEVALGYRIHAQQRNAAESYGVKVNPNKALSVMFSEDDRIVVLAEQ